MKVTIMTSCNIDKVMLAFAEILAEQERAIITDVVCKESEAKNEKLAV